MLLCTARLGKIDRGFVGPEALDHIKTSGADRIIILLQQEGVFAAIKLVERVTFEKCLEARFPIIDDMLARRHEGAAGLEDAKDLATELFEIASVGQDLAPINRSEEHTS